jgi:translocation protein SEC66
MSIADARPVSRLFLPPTAGTTHSDFRIWMPLAQATYEPWFPQHVARDAYVSLLSHPTPVPNNVLIAALLRRAMTDVERLWAIRDSKQALSNLLQRGQIGDELWTRFQEAEKELEAEILEVVEEANSFRQNWGQTIFTQASDMVQHDKIKEIFSNIEQDKEREYKACLIRPSLHLTDDHRVTQGVRDSSKGPRSLPSPVSLSATRPPKVASKPPIPSGGPSADRLSPPSMSPQGSSGSAAPSTADNPPSRPPSTVGSRTDGSRSDGEQEKPSSSTAGQNTPVSTQQSPKNKGKSGKKGKKKR